MRGDRLKRIREARGYTQDELSEMVGVGQKQVWRHESGATVPDGDIVAKYAQVLDVSTDYLLGVSDDQKPNIQVSDLTRTERAILSALRRGERIEAIKIIANDEKAVNGV